MHQDQNSARLLGSQRQLLQMVLSNKIQQDDGSDVSRPALGMRTQSPSLQVDDIQGPQGYPDVDAMGPQMFGNPGAHNQLMRAAEEAFAAQIEDRYVDCRASWVPLQLPKHCLPPIPDTSSSSTENLLTVAPVQETPTRPLALGHGGAKHGHWCSWTRPQHPWQHVLVQGRLPRTPPEPTGICSGGARCACVLTSVCAHRSQHRNSLMC
jgi:hypothetical protein